MLYEILGFLIVGGEGGKRTLNDTWAAIKAFKMQPTLMGQAVLWRKKKQSIKCIQLDFNGAWPTLYSTSACWPYADIKPYAKLNQTALSVSINDVPRANHYLIKPINNIKILTKKKKSSQETDGYLNQKKKKSRTYNDLLSSVSFCF